MFPPDRDALPRREVLRATGALGTAAGLSACLGSDDGGGDGGADTGGDRNASFTAGDPPDLPTVQDPPDVVYVPSHREGTEMLGTETAGEYEVSAMVSYAHSFWLVTGDRVEPVEVGTDDDVHLMVAVRDAETGTVLPARGLTWEVRAGGDLVDPRSPWRMLSQTMGFHFGDNVELDGDGEYEVTVEVPPLSARRTGALAGRFESAETASFSVTYDRALRDRLIDGIEYVAPDQRGVPGAIEFSMGGALPLARDLPGTLQGAGDADGDAATDGDGDSQLPRSHDAAVAIAVVEGFGGDADGGGPYLLVSPRTPYNRAPLVGASVSARVARDGTEVRSPDLVPTVDDRAGFHYGAAIPALEPGDDLEVRFDAPPSVERHQGYETAFLDMDPVTATVEEW